MMDPEMYQVNSVEVISKEGNQDDEVTEPEEFHHNTGLTENIIRQTPEKSDQKEEPTELDQVRVCKNESKLSSDKNDQKEQVEANGMLHGCDSCKQTFALWYNFMAQAKVRSLEKQHKCDTCGRRYSVRLSLLQVNTQNTRTKITKNSSSNKEVCQNEVPRAYMEVLPKPVELQCAQCEKKFTNFNSLQLHVRNHIKRKRQRCRAICEYCGKEFKQGYLKTHLRTHTGEKPFKCHECGREFRTMSQLNKHLQKHTEESKFLCDECGKIFTEKSCLRRHKLIHIGELPFKCRYCPKRVNRAENLRTHERTHSGDKPFKCSSCECSFSHNVSLKNHIKVSHG